MIPLYILLLSLSAGVPVNAQSPRVSTIAGTGAEGFAQNVRATEAPLVRPRSVFVDTLGNVFFADSGLDRIMRIDAESGILTTAVGDGFADYAGDGLAATRASLNNPRGVFVDTDGSIYFADQNNHRIRKVDAVTGLVSTVAGDGVPRFLDDGYSASTTPINSPSDVFLDRDGNMFIADTGNNRIRRVDAETGIITTVAGRFGEGFSGDGGPATEAMLDSPVSVVVDVAGRIYICDGGNFRVRRVELDGTIVTIAGSAPRPSVIGLIFPGYSGDGGPATMAEFDLMKDIFVDSGGNLYISDENNNRVRRVDPNGIITTIVGDGFVASEGGGRFNGDSLLATETSLNDPKGVFVDRNGDLYIADEDNHRVRKVAGLGSPTNLYLTVDRTSDFDGNGDTDFTDFLLFVDAFGLRAGESGYEVEFDLDGSGEIGFGDFLIFALEFG